MNWKENLPDQCPPKDASKPSEVSYYRITASESIQEGDFIPHKKLYPHKTYHDECIAMSLSVYSNIDDCRELLKLPKFKKSSISELALNENDGLIKKTFDKSHFSWWVSADFDISQANNVQ